MTHEEYMTKVSKARNSIAFAARMRRAYAKRAEKFSSPAEPASAGLASAGATGAGEVQIGTADDSKPGVNSPASGFDSQRPAIVLIPMLAQVHADRLATLAVIFVFICIFAVSAWRANRSSIPTTPTRSRSGGSDSHNNRS